MKILAITQSGKISGGANRSFFDVLRRLKNDYGHDITVLSPENGAFVSKLYDINIKCIIHKYYQTAFVTMGDIFDPYRHFKMIVNCLYNFKVAVELKNIFFEENFDVIYINDTTNTIGYYLSKMLKIPYVWHFRGYQHVIKKYMINECKLQKQQDGIILNISNAMYCYMRDERKIREDKMVVIYNGVENNINDNNRKNNSFSSGFHCVQCGHISEAKGQIDAIKALEILKNNGYQDIYLHLAGTPSYEHGESYKDILINEIKKRNLSNNIIFEGEVEDMPSLRSRMDIELVCSICEPFGRVTVEAMQSGLPVIGANTGGTPEIIIDGENGFLYEQGNPQSLANNILKLYSDKELKNKMSDNAVAYTKNHFTMTDNVRQINEELFNAVKLYGGKIQNEKEE